MATPSDDPYLFPLMAAPLPAAASPSGLVIGQQRHEPAGAHVPRTGGAHGCIVARRKEPSQLHLVEVDRAATSEVNARMGGEWR